jgi:hypothetical protein
MSWLNHYLDYAPVKEGMGGVTGETGETGETGTIEVKEGMVVREGFDGSEQYSQLFRDVAKLWIYYVIFLAGLLIGVPIIFYYFFLAGSDYFPTDYIAYKDPTTQVTEDEPKVSSYLKIPNKNGEPGHYQVYLNKTPFKGLGLLGIKNPYYLPTKDYDGKYYPDCQVWYERYFRKVLSITLVASSQMLKFVSGFSPQLIIYLLIIAFGAVFITSAFKRGEGDPKVYINYFYTIPVGILLFPILFWAAASAFYSSTALLMTYDPSRNPPYKCGDYGFDTFLDGFYSVVILFFKAVAAVCFFIPLGLSFGIIIGIYVIISYLVYALGTGCYILKDKAIPLNLFTFYNLLKYYCITSAHWIVPILLLVFIEISLSIDTTSGYIYFGFWVTGFTILGFLLLMGPWSKFRESWAQHFLEHALLINKKVGIEKEKDKTECEKLDEKLLTKNIGDDFLEDFNLNPEESKSGESSE